MLRAARAVLVAVSAAALAQGAACQDLSGLWFKVKVKSSGYSIGAEGQEVKQAKVSAEACVLFVASVVDGGDGGLATTLYDWQVWCETTPGSWSLTESGAAYVEERDGTHSFLTDFDLEWFNDGSQARSGKLVKPEQLPFDPGG